jgi:hypothetical protein
MTVTEVLDLLLPNVSGHRPARNKNNRSALSRINVVEFHTITGFKELTSRFGGAQRNRQQHETDDYADRI